MPVRQVFKNELASIVDDHIRCFVTGAFDMLCPSYFWTIPASQRGHHPQVCQGEGGLVRHTKLAVRFGYSFMEMWPPSHQIKIATTQDEVVAALLLHDMFKRGAVEDETVTFGSHQAAVARHGIYCAMRLQWLWEDDADWRSIIPTDCAQRIMAAVRDHMGHWTAGIIFEPREMNCEDVVRYTTHLADYAASRHIDEWLKTVVADTNEK